MNGKRKTHGKAQAGSAPEKRPLSEWLVNTLDIPPDILEGGLSVELRGRNKLLIRGCRRILQYTPEDMSFQMKGCVLRINGKRLVCHSFLSGAVGIEGMIQGICFVDQDTPSGKEEPLC